MNLCSANDERVIAVKTYMSKANEGWHFAPLHDNVKVAVSSNFVTSAEALEACNAALRQHEK
eukprot:9933771-Ditylum_brightwellii.AAC.1